MRNACRPTSINKNTITALVHKLYYVKSQQFLFLPKCSRRAGKQSRGEEEMEERGNRAKEEEEEEGREGAQGGG